MSRFIAIALNILIILTSSLVFPAATWAVDSSLGLKDGYLSPCPPSPNCVVSQNADDKKHSIAPISYQTDLDTAKANLLKVLSVVPRTEIVEQTDNYIRAQSTSRIFKFVDDVEFYFPSNENKIQMRSASRVGESDLGVNRRRLEQIRLAMKDLEDENSVQN